MNYSPFSKVGMENTAKRLRDSQNQSSGVGLGIVTGAFNGAETGQCTPADNFSISEKLIPNNNSRIVAENLIRNYVKDPNQILAEACRRSFFKFVQYFWDTIIPETLVCNWHIPYLCQEAQLLVERAANKEPKLYDLIINVPPGSTKSTLFVQMLPAWSWTRWPAMRYICGSYSGDLAIEHGGLCKDIVTSEKYQRLYPELKIRTDQDAKSNFKFRSGGQRTTCSVGGTITGKHAHVIVVDDPINPKKAASDIEVKNANDWMDQTLSTRKVDKASTPTILVMQRLHQNDPSGNWLEKAEAGSKRVRHICLPGELDGYPVKPEELEQYYTNGLLDPERMGTQALEDIKADLGQYGYAGQIGQQPTPPSGGMFNVGAFEFCDAPPSKPVTVIRYWDKAGTQDDGAYSVGLKMAKMKDGRYLIMDLIRGQWKTHVREQHILSTAQMDGKKVFIGIEQEPGSGGKESAENTVKRLTGYRVRVDRPTGDKIFRADPFSVQVNWGNVVVLRGAWNKDFVEECRFFPYSKYKDQVDAASGAFAFLNKLKKRAGAFGR